jgi:transposase
VIGPSGNIRVMVATKPVDFRKGSEGLAALVRETMRLDPFSGVVYVFRAEARESRDIVHPFVQRPGNLSDFSSWNRL